MQKKLVSISLIVLALSASPCLARTRHSSSSASTASGAGSKHGSTSHHSSKHSRASSRRRGSRSTQQVVQTKGHSHAKHTALAPEPMVESSEYQTQAKLYGLYDQGINARLNGDPRTAVSRLIEAQALISTSHLSPTMEAMTEYELGRAAEADQQPQVALDSYRRCIEINPRHSDAVIRLSSLLLRSGQPAQALVRMRDLLQRAPNDAKAHFALAVVLEKNGFPDDARVERDRAQQLISGAGKVAEPAQPIQQTTSGGQSIEPMVDETTDMEPGAKQATPASQAPLGDALTPAPVPGQPTEGTTGAPPPSSSNSEVKPSEK